MKNAAFAVECGDTTPSTSKEYSSRQNGIIEERIQSIRQDCSTSPLCNCYFFAFDTIHKTYDPRQSIGPELIMCKEYRSGPTQQVAGSHVISLADDETYPCISELKESTHDVEQYL